jgi:2-polyprenyl-6-methoxyphenol hydroxylase-like FAD-dependent oxidoreductase
MLLDRPGNPTSARPKIDRGELRTLLLGALPAGTVRWGHKVTAVNTEGPGRHEVEFAENSRVMTVLLVGADGAWSRVRPLLTAALSISNKGGEVKCAAASFN